ncbi:hypothetical protein FACS1894191_4440 [Clostridia bacterium]|nr:hypothetical protein FACS1894191_4440 [Clostridia bacterium]
MKLGCCLNVNALEPYGIGGEAISACKEFGYDYIELPLAQVMDLSGDEFGRLLDGIKSGGTPVGACNIFFPGSIRFVGEDAMTGPAIEYAKRACDRAAAMGAEIIVLGSSKSRNIPEGFPREHARRQFIALLGNIQEIAGPLGITVVLEPLNRGECNFINSAEEGLGIVREAALDNIKLLIDYYHMRVENESTAVIAKCKDALRHIHIAAKNGRAFPSPNDGEDYAGFFSALKAAGYDGRVSIEAHSTDLAGDAARSAELLRAHM